MKEPLVWIIDDDNLFYLITKNNLRKTGIVTNTDFFFDGLSSILALKEMLATQKTLPTLIVLDLNMPLHDGWSFLDEYVLLPQEARSQMKVHICSSSIDPADIARAQLIPDVLGFQEKPLSTEFLLQLLTSA